MRQFLFLLFFAIYLQAFSQGSFDQSDNCNYNSYHNYVHHSSFDNEIRSVVNFGRLVIVDGQFWKESNCTGTFLNQVNRSNGQLQQVFLTADHCVKNLRPDDLLVFFFNYQSPNGSNSDVPMRQLIQGDFLLDDFIYRGNDGSIQFSMNPTLPEPLNYMPNPLGFFFRDLRYIHISTVERLGRWNDLAIMRIVEPIPAWFNVFYSGWNGLAPIVPSLQTVVPGISWDPMYGPAPFYCISQINSFKLCYQELFIG